MGQATLVSFAPFLIRERKPSLRPYEYELKASKDGKPSVLPLGRVQQSRYVITSGNEEGGSTIWEELDPETAGRAIVMDYITSKECYAPGGVEDMAAPAFFVVPGLYTEETAEEVKRDHAGLVKVHLFSQIRWCEALIRVADDNWVRYKSHRTISDDMRNAVRYLKMQRDWLTLRPDQMPIPPKMKDCPACGESVKDNVIVCKSCKYVFDKKKAAEMGIGAAPVSP